MKLRVMIVTKSDLRHRLFLRMVEEALGDNWVATCVQVGPEASHVAGYTATLKQRFAIFFRNLINFTRLALSRFGSQSADRHMEKMLNILPISDFDIPGLFKTANPNSPEALDFLRAMAPDIVLVYGAAILKYDWLTAPPTSTVQRRRRALRSMESTT